MVLVIFTFLGLIGTLVLIAWFVVLPAEQWALFAAGILLGTTLCLVVSLVHQQLYLRQLEKGSEPEKYPNCQCGLTSAQLSQVFDCKRREVGHQDMRSLYK